MDVVIYYLGESDSRRCHYPSWFLAHNRWQTLDGRWSYNPHKNTTLRITNITAHGTSSSTGPAFSSGGSTNGGNIGVDSRQEQKAVCQSVLDLGDGAARVVAHLSQGWCVSVTFVMLHHHYLFVKNPLAAPRVISMGIEPGDLILPLLFHEVSGAKRAKGGTQTNCFVVVVYTHTHTHPIKRHPNGSLFIFIFARMERERDLEVPPSSFFIIILADSSERGLLRWREKKDRW